MTDSELNDDRTDLYLSGGGFRAALGALGVVFFLIDAGKWPSVRRIVSVSGGGVVNAAIAALRPNSDGLTARARDLFTWLTDRRRSTRRLTLVLGAGALLAVAVGVVTHVVYGGVVLSVAVALVVFLIELPLIARLWLFLIFRSLVGSTRFDDLESDPSWLIEHVFTASDLTRHGSMFLVANCIQPLVASRQQGTFDGRGTTFRRALRATTALPPILPPLRWRLRRTPPRRARRHLGPRDWVAPREDESSHAVWLADGGLTGNLGIQLDGALSPDNLALLELLGSTTKAGTPQASAPYDCPSHDEIAWLCRQCRTETLIVDASGMSPRSARWVEALLHVPLIGAFVYAVRSLQVAYESSLVDDQSHADHRLVGVVRADQLAMRLARQDQARDISNSAPSGMVWAGGLMTRMSFIMNDELRDAVPGVTPLVAACLRAREAAARVPTGLVGVPARAAAQVVASAYLNACLVMLGPDSFERADEGIRRLSRHLGASAGLESWWADLVARRKAW